MINTPNYSFRCFWSEEDAAYVATCAELPELSGVAESPEEALGELRCAIELAAEEFAETGQALPDPLVSDTHSGQFRLRLPKSMHAALSQRAEAEGVSLNALALSYVSLGLGGALGRKHACETVLDAVARVTTAIEVQASYAADVYFQESPRESLDVAATFPLTMSNSGVKSWQS